MVEKDINLPKYGRDSPGYQQYIHSEEWKNKKEAARIYHGNYCHACKSTSRIDIHHRTYSRFKKEEMTDLVPLCRTCHFKVHEIDRSGLLNPLDKPLWKITEEYISAKSYYASQIKGERIIFPEIHGANYRELLNLAAHQLNSQPVYGYYAIRREEIELYINSLDLNLIQKQKSLEIAFHYNNDTRESSWKIKAKRPDIATSQVWLWSKAMDRPYLSVEAIKRILLNRGISLDNLNLTLFSRSQEMAAGQEIDKEDIIEYIVNSSPYNNEQKHAIEIANLYNPFEGYSTYKAKIDLPYDSISKYWKWKFIGDYCTLPILAIEEIMKFKNH